MKKVHLFLLLALCFIVSRLIFSLIDDPEGPNLLIVTVLALGLFAPVFFIYHMISRRR
jgi:hypothetical protein